MAFLWHIGHPYMATFAVMGGIFLFMMWLLYSINQGMPITTQQRKSVEARRQHITCDSEGMILDLPLFQARQYMKWRSVEAIILHSYPPREGDGHEQRLDISLNKLPEVKYYHALTWYNRVFKFKSNKLEITVYDDAIGFIKFAAELNKHLDNVNPKTEQLMRQRFSGTHIIFDRGGNTCNPLLLEHRRNSL